MAAKLYVDWATWKAKKPSTGFLLSSFSSLLERKKTMKGPLPGAIFARQIMSHISQLTHQKGTNTTLWGWELQSWESPEECEGGLMFLSFGGKE